jgi:dTDP-4-amino-4,6-dideoxygalactose transaminase
VSSSEERIALAEPTLGGNAAAYLEECLRTNFVSSVGPFVGRFEAAFAETVGARFAVACSSGTAAIHLGFRVLDVGPDDEVLVPTLTFVASANPVRYVGATPILVDSEPATMNVDPGLVVAELDERARAGRRQPAAIEIVHLLGHPAVLEPVVAAAERHGVPILEDASEALGARYVGGPLDGRHVGTIGRVGAFSFNGNKLITTGGGGMLVTDDEGLARRARHLSTQARLPGAAYDHDDVGYNYRLPNLAAALGLAQLEQLPELLEGRRDNATAYDAAIAGIPALRPAPRAAWADPSFWLYTATVAPDASPIGRDELLGRLGARGIEARPIWTPLHRTRLYRDAPRIGGLVAEVIFETAFSLPSSSNLGAARHERVVAALRDTLG